MEIPGGQSAQLDDGVYAIREPDFTVGGEFNSIAYVAAAKDGATGYLSEFVAHLPGAVNVAPMELTAPSLYDPSQVVSRDIVHAAAYGGAVPNTPHDAFVGAGLNPAALDVWHMESVADNAVASVPATAPSAATGHERWWIADSSGDNVAALVTWINRAAGANTCAVGYLFSTKTESGTAKVKFPLALGDPNSPLKIVKVDARDPAQPWTVLQAYADTAVQLKNADLSVSIEKLIGLTHLGVGGLTSATPWGTSANMPADNCGAWRP